MSEGKINVQAENIFPIIKKFLYSDQEIFLRELVSNAVDACQKLKTLGVLGEAEADEDNLRVEVKLDAKKKTITISDNGIGMNAEEVEKYIAQIAFSGAEEFVEKYKDQAQGIIGHFGLGFYSAFMVADKVEVISKSHKGGDAAHWTCEGNPEYDLKVGKKKTRGTDIILHVSEDAKDYLQDHKINELLNKYAKFLPIPIKYGTRETEIDDPKGAKEKDKDGKETIKKVKKTVDNIINNPTPAWTKKPTDLTDENYKGFYRELYPMTFEDPLFHIHLNVDYPFNLTGILYFPKLKGKMEMQRNKIQLYSNQVYVTDSVEGIVPEFLTLLHGVIDSPDIPLNVSRSYLQSDGNVKKISSHITKKVADKLEDLFKKDRAAFEAKWEDIQVFIEYGMLTDDKFYDKCQKFYLYKANDGKFFTTEEYTEKIKAAQTDKDGNLVFLYSNDFNTQHSLIEAAKNRDYSVVLLDTPTAPHFVGKLEQKLEKTKFTRIDGDTIDKLIEKEENIPSKLSEDDKKVIQPVLEQVVDKAKFTVQFQSMSEKDRPAVVVLPEFMRRMKEMSAMGGGGMMGMGNMPEMYNLVVNENHPIIGKMLTEKDNAKQKNIAKQVADLALLSQNLLQGEELTKFINRSIESI